MTDLESGILVLGAGLQGAGVALELAQRGIPVTLVEQDEVALNRASLRNEGKIHLGLIYANDRSRDTAFLSSRGLAIPRDPRPLARFRAQLARPTRRPFTTSSRAIRFWRRRRSLALPRCRGALPGAARRGSVARLSRPTPDWLFRPLTSSELAAHFDAARFAAGFATAELAIDTATLASPLREALAASPRIAAALRTCARAIEREAGDSGRRGDPTGHGASARGRWSTRAGSVGSRSIGSWGSSPRPISSTGSSSASSPVCRRSCVARPRSRWCSGATATS